MASNLFRTSEGFSDGKKWYLSGSGSPGGDTGFEDNAPRGSEYQDTDTGNIYIKHTAGAGAGTWERLARISDVGGNPSGSSWRETVLAADFTASDLPTIIAGINTTNTFQGESVYDGARLLLGATSSQNVYIVSGSANSWTLTEDDNSTSSGDTLQVLGGDYAGRVYSYTTTEWIWILQPTSDELGFIRGYVGKIAAGVEVPAYTTNHYVANDDTLVVAIGKLDAALSTTDSNVSTNDGAISDVAGEVDDIETGAGLEADGSYLANESTNYLGSATSLKVADEALDAQLKTTTDDLGTLSGEVGDIETGAGLEADGSYSANELTNYLGSATSLKAADEALDAQLKTTTDDLGTLEGVVGDNSSYSSTTFIANDDSLVTAVGKLDAAISNVNSSSTTEGITTATTVGSVLVDSVWSAKWILTGQQASTPTNRTMMEVLAVHNGTAGADATTVEWSTYGVVEIGSTISGFTVAVVLAGSGTSQTMELQVTSTAEADVTVIKV